MAAYPANGTMHASFNSTRCAHPQSPPLDTYLMITNEPAYHHQKTYNKDVHPDVEITACPKCVPVTFKAQKGIPTKKRKTGDQQDD